MTDAGRVLRTVSLRRRVILTATTVVAVALAGVVLVVSVVFDVAAKREVRAILGDRVQIAQQLSKQGVAPVILLRRIDGRSVRAQLTLTSGRTIGSVADLPPADDPRLREVRLRGKGKLAGAQLTLVADTALLSGAQLKLFWLLVFAGLAALVLIVLALLVSVRFALAPLDAMTSLARGIARGGRGRRLVPERTNTELGRTAAAFDDMLDALEGAEAQARAANEQTRRFVADAAHELRTPIAGVAAAAEAVLQMPADAGVDDWEQRQRLELLLVRESHRAAGLIDDLLDLARIDAGVRLQLEPVDLSALAMTQVERARLQHPGVDVDITALDGQHIVVDADSARISQVLANLVDNACQATPSGGQVRVGLSGTANRADVVVSDSGPGVPEGDRERIFERLVRLDEARDRRAGGFGLGLAIARGFARAHGGDLRCEPPAPGATGAIFRLSLPRRPLPAR